jgi:hypothetical protein
MLAMFHSRGSGRGQPPRPRPPKRSDRLLHMQWVDPTELAVRPRFGEFLLGVEIRKAAVPGVVRGWGALAAAAQP